MLRQLFRQRGAYNFVNLPIATSQDDPSTSSGYGDGYADWRRHYNPAMEPEFREDVGLEAWERPNWYTDRGLSSTAAAKILRKRLETYGPQRERSLQEVIGRIRSEKDAEMALKAAELFRRYRSSREQHSPFKNSTSKLIVQRALEVNAGEVAVEALARKDELGFNFLSLKAYRQAITHFSTKGDLKNVLKVFELAKQQGMRPNRDIAFCILRACLDCGRPDMAYAYAIEFQANELRVSPAQRVKIEAESGKMLPPFPGEAEEGVMGSVESNPTESSSPDASASFADTVLEEADRIIAATGEHAAAEQATEETLTSVSTTGEGEAALPDGSVIPEFTVSQGRINAPAASETQQTGSGSAKQAVVAVAVEAEEVESESLTGAASEEAIGAIRSLAERFQLADVPGLKEAVTASLEADAKEKKLLLQRANSI